MDKKLLDMMNDAERELLRDVYGRKLGTLDEEELVELHNRVRRARNKYSKLYRRQGAARVKKDKSRGRASGSNQRTALKAEVFEDALATVSRQLARVAWKASDRLKKERLAAARQARSAKPAASKGKGKAKGKAAAKASTSEKKKVRTGASKRASAQARAATRKSQATRSSKKG